MEIHTYNTTVNYYVLNTHFGTYSSASLETITHFPICAVYDYHCFVSKTSKTQALHQSLNLHYQNDFIYQNLFQTKWCFLESLLK